MNYYKMSNTETTIETHPPVILPQLMNYRQFSDKAHDSLMRCQDCGIKFDLHDLSRLGVGKFICKFCLKVGA